MVTLPGLEPGFAPWKGAVLDQLDDRAKLFFILIARIFKLIIIVDNLRQFIRLNLNVEIINFFHFDYLSFFILHKYYNIFFIKSQRRFGVCGRALTYMSVDLSFLGRCVSSASAVVFRHAHNKCRELDQTLRCPHTSGGDGAFVLVNTTIPWHLFITLITQFFLPGNPRWCPRPDSNRHAARHLILSQTSLPFHHSGIYAAFYRLPQNLYKTHFEGCSPSSAASRGSVPLWLNT